MIRGLNKNAGGPTRRVSDGHSRTSSRDILTLGPLFGSTVIDFDITFVPQMKLKTLWPEDCPRVREALGMTEEGVKKDVAALKDWLRKQPHLGPLIGGQLHTYIIGFRLIHYYLCNHLCCKFFLLSSKQAMLNIYYVIKRCIFNVKD